MKRSTNFYLPKHIFILILALTLCLFSATLLTIQLKKPLHAENSSEIVEDILSYCGSVKNQNLCYNDKIANLMNPPNQFSMEQAFSILKLIKDKKTTYMNCHVLAHKLSSKETAKNPNNWKEIITKCPNNVCNSGCTHGVLMEKFKSEYLTDSQINQLKPDLATVCISSAKWHPSKSDLHECHHGLGHLAMYLTNGNIDKSIKLCQEINVGSYSDTETCISAVFMQVFQPLDPDDVALVKRIAPAKNKDSVDKFCDQYTGLSYYTCRKESWIYFWDDLKKPEELAQFCSYSNDVGEQEKCYAQIISAITSNFAIKENNLPKLIGFCNQLAPHFVSVCFANAARKIVQTNIKLVDKALAICSTAQQQSLEDGEKCYNLLAKYEQWISSPNDTDLYCSKLPKEWQSICL